MWLWKTYIDWKLNFAIKILIFTFGSLLLISPMIGVGAADHTNTDSPLGKNSEVEVTIITEETQNPAYDVNVTYEYVLDDSTNPRSFSTSEGIDVLHREKKTLDDGRTMVRVVTGYNFTVRKNHDRHLTTKDNYIIFEIDGAYMRGFPPNEWFNRSVRVSSEGTGSYPIVYLGEYDETKINVHNSTVRIVNTEPASWGLQNSSKELQDRLRVANHKIPTDQPETVTYIVFPNSSNNPTDGVSYDSDTISGTPQGTAIRDVSLLFHEYVHVHQSGHRKVGTGMLWITEGMASYYETVLYFNTINDATTYPLTQLWTYDENNDVNAGVLSKKYTWENSGEYESPESASPTPYKRGSWVLARLNEQIWTETNGTASVDDVIHRLYTSEKKITLERFEKIIADYIGQEEAELFVSKYITSNFNKEESEIENLTGDAFTITWDPDGDGLGIHTEYKFRTDPFDADTDGDGFSDGEELETNSNPHVSEMTPTQGTSFSTLWRKYSNYEIGSFIVILLSICGSAYVAYTSLE